MSATSRPAIWKTLTALEPELALRTILKHSVAIGGEVDPDEVCLTSFDRDSVIESLPANYDWVEIAERFIDREFVSGQSSEELPHPRHAAW